MKRKEENQREKPTLYTPLPSPRVLAISSIADVYVSERCLRRRKLDALGWGMGTFRGRKRGYEVAGNCEVDIGRDLITWKGCFLAQKREMERNS